MKTRQEALTLLDELVQSESLKKHCSSAPLFMEEYAMKCFAGREIDK